MKVEIEITKKDLRRIFYAALRYYHRDLRSRVSEDELPGALWYAEIADNLCEIRGACDTISNLCDLIEELDTVDNDVNGVIIFDPDKEEQK